MSWLQSTSHSLVAKKLWEEFQLIFISILILKELIKSHGDTKDPPGVQPSQRHRPSGAQRALESQAGHFKVIPNQKAAAQNKNVRLETIWTHKFIPQTLQSVLVVMKVTTLIPSSIDTHVCAPLYMFWEFARQLVPNQNVCSPVIVGMSGGLIVQSPVPNEGSSRDA